MRSSSASPRAHGIARGAPAAAGRFPLLVFNHGAGSYREQNTFLMEHLASSGYVVASVAHPHESGSYMSADGELVRLSEQVKQRQNLLAR